MVGEMVRQATAVDCLLAATKGSLEGLESQDSPY